MKRHRLEKILIVSRVPDLYSNQRLVQELKHKNLLYQIIPPDHEKIKSACHGIPEKSVAALIRLASWRFQEGLEELKKATGQIAMMNSIESFEASRNKWHALQILEKNQIPTPLSQIISRDELYIVDLTYPFVLKEIFSSQGLGVYLIQNFQELEKALHLLKESDLFIAQSYLKECHGEDLRIFMTLNGDHWCMKRKNSSGDFRSNVHQGGQGSRDIATTDELEMAFLALKIFNLDYAGIDLLRSSSGPLMIDVNPSPGFEKLEAIYGPQVAGPLVSLLLSKF